MNKITMTEKLISELRQKLYTLIEETNDLVKDEVVEASQKLDKALDLYIELTENTNLKKTG